MMSFISISIDICGSTDAKARLRNHSGVVGKIPTEFYEEYQKQVMRVEETFWTMLRSNDLDIQRLFLIKSIGDEIWYSYDLSELHEFECHAAYAQIIESLLALQSKPFDLAAGPPEDPNDWESFTPGTILRIDLPLKITVDLISDALDLKSEREKFLSPHVASLLSPFGKPTKPIYAGDDDYIMLCNRLGIANQVKTDTKVLSSVRSDYIGWEIDRFFRLTKFAVQGAVLVGPEILYVFDSHDLICSIDQEKLRRVGRWIISEARIKLKTGPDTFTSPYDHFLLARRCILPNELKGVGVGCDICVVYSKWNKISTLDADKPKRNIFQMIISTFVLISTLAILIDSICCLNQCRSKQQK